MLLRGREYDSQSALDRQLLAYVLIPVVQHESDIFVRYWNSHGIRMQDKLRGVAKLSRVMDGDVFDFITPRVRRECLQLLSNPEKVESKDTSEAFKRGCLHKNRPLEFWQTTKFHEIFTVR